MLSKPSNIFNNLLDITPPPPDDRDKLDCYLAIDVEDMKDGLMWWHEKCTAFSCLLHMAQNYLSILGKCAIFPNSTLKLIFCPLATSVDIE